MKEKRHYTLADREVQEESRRTRRLQIVISLVMNIISQGNMPLDEASQLVAATKRVALSLFPDKESTYDILYKPRLQRLLIEKYRLQ